MKIYNVLGYAALVLQLALSALLAPPWLGPWWGMAIGFGYLLISWFVCGVYLSDVMHMGIAHGALDYQEWFIKGLTLVNNAFGVYVDPVSWVNRHRLHHRFSDHDGDPNKLAGDGFWTTLYRCVFPYACTMNVAKDDILKTWPFRLVAHPLFTAISPVLSCGLLWLFVRDWPFAIVVWAGTRLFALWVNMVQNYWTHDRRWGTRRYDDGDDNAMNIGDWLPVTATFSACLQNNHHHSPALLRLSHEESEYDLGFMAVKIMKSLGLVSATTKGAQLPADIPLRSLNF